LASFLWALVFFTFVIINDGVPGAHPATWRGQLASRGAGGDGVLTGVGSNWERWRVVVVGRGRLQTTAG